MRLLRLEGDEQTKLEAHVSEEIQRAIIEVGEELGLK